MVRPLPALPSRPPQPSLLRRATEPCSNDTGHPPAWPRPALIFLSLMECFALKGRKRREASGGVRALGSQCTAQMPGQPRSYNEEGQDGERGGTTLTPRPEQRPPGRHTAGRRIRAGRCVADGPIMA